MSEFIGIDVSKARLDVAVHGGDGFAVENAEAEVGRLCERLKELAPRWW